MARRHSRSATQPETLTPSLRDAPWSRFTLIGTAWLLEFLVYFSASTLPNNPVFRRWALWLYLPDYFLTYFSAAADPEFPSGWRFLPQRFDLLAVAALVLGGAIAAGRLLLRALRVFAELPDAERTVFSAGLGLSFVSLITLGFGLAQLLHRPLFVALLVLPMLAEAGLLVMKSRSTSAPESPSRTATGQDREESAEVPSANLRWLLTITLVPFLLAMLLGAMLPDSDFDVREYHLQGPKEYLQNGGISFLPHNVYTSFPFLTEMLSLCSMVVRDDWFRGALAGKAVLMSFAPLTGIAVFALARRVAGPMAGWLAAVIHLSTPWTYRISIIAYAEGGLTFFLTAALLAALMAIDRLRAGEASSRWTLLAGLLAGSAMSCKYPGVLSVVIPLGAAMVVAAFRAPSNSAWRNLARVAGLYSAGVLLAVGPWLVKNLLETGNPVYPLVASLFGGRDWSPEMNAKWKAAHSPDDYDVTRLWFWITDVSARNDWLSPLLYGFAPLAFFARSSRKRVRDLAFFAAYLFATWWLFTHRLDRFWVPMLPVIATLAGIGAVSIRDPGWRVVRTVVLIACLAFNLRIVTSPLGGPNAYLVDLDRARVQVAGPSIAALNQLPAGSRVLCVGEAGVFDITVPVVYNTVFDESIFQQWCEDPDGQGLRPAAEIRERLRDEGITHLFVNWAEILRYRATYGYTEFVTPDRFDSLQQMGILESPIPLGRSALPTGRELTEWKRWGNSLRAAPVMTPDGPVETWTAQQLFPVVESIRRR